MNFDELSPERVELWKRLFGQVSPSLMKSFKAFHAENGHVFNAFRALALQAKDAGIAKTSHWLIINKLRWDYAIQTSGKAFRISNDHIALYPRLLIWQNPEFDGFFELKRMNPRRKKKMNSELQEAA